MYTHENFTDDFDNDIAVLILDAPVKIGKFVSEKVQKFGIMFHYLYWALDWINQARPVCLPRSNREQSLHLLGLSDTANYQKTGIIAGWGVTGVQNISLLLIALKRWEKI